MSSTPKNQKNILDKLNIEILNPMQEEAQTAILTNSEIVLLSPTGTGKTLAYLLPIIEEMDKDSIEVQVLILVPSRELAIQIEQVIREMGAGYKTNAIYGGRTGSKDKIDLKHRPAILIGTPGRIADHLRRQSFSLTEIKTLVLDEFDKSLEIGFEKEMIEIMEALPEVKKKILTSASNKAEIPKFIGLNQPVYIDYLNIGNSQLKVKTIISPSKDKLKTLVDTLCHIGNQPGIIFCNFKDTIQYVSDYLLENEINHACFHGGMEQKHRELALIKFRNGTHQLLIATDLAARGIDVPEMKFIIHYQLPQKAHEFMHRNGRTARMNSDGTAYILKWEHENLPEYITETEIEKLQKEPKPEASKWKTIYITGGRRDKISKGDIAGLFFKQGNLKQDELGNIELNQECSYVSVPASKINHLTEGLNNSKLKKKKVRISEI